MSADRIADCRELLDGIADESVEDQAEILERVHVALTGELDELLRRDRPPA